MVHVYKEGFICSLQNPVEMNEFEALCTLCNEHEFGTLYMKTIRTVFISMLNQ